MKKPRAERFLVETGGGPISISPKNNVHSYKTAGIGGGI